MSFFQNGPEILSRIGATHDDRVAASHDMLEKWERQEAFFDDKGDITVGLNQARQDKGLQNTHVIADKHTSRFEFSENSQVLNLETSPNGLECFYGI